MALNSARFGDPAAHRRALGPVAARRLDALRVGDADGGSWWSLEALATVPDRSLDDVVLCGALCARPDLDATIAELRRVLAPGARLEALEHVGRRGVIGRLQRLADPAYAALPGTCHIDHDVPAALRAGGFDILRIDRLTVPSLVPVLRRWVRLVARCRS